VESPDFIAQEKIAFYEGARRYEPGSLNLPGIFAMQAAAELILETGVDAVSARLLDLRIALLERLQPLDIGLYWDRKWRKTIFRHRVFSLPGRRFKGVDVETRKRKDRGVLA